MKILGKIILVVLCGFIFCYLGSYLIWYAVGFSQYFASKNKVRDKETAIKIARSVTEGCAQDRVDVEDQFMANLKSGLWEVEGRVICGNCSRLAKVVIKKFDGRIVKVQYEPSVCADQK